MSFSPDFCSINCELMMSLGGVAWMFWSGKKKQSPLEGDCIFQSFQSSATLLLQKLCTMTNASHLDRFISPMASWRSLSRSIHSKAELHCRCHAAIAKASVQKKIGPFSARSSWWSNQTPLKKYARQNGFIFPIFGVKIPKNWNHHPALDLNHLSCWKKCRLMEPSTFSVMKWCKPIGSPWCRTRPEGHRPQPPGVLQNQTLKQRTKETTIYIYMHI